MIAPNRIPTAIRTLVDDGKAWVEYGTYEPDELAVRFHHRLVAIHPFPNDNGRHGRIAADYLIRSLGREPFSWGAGLDVDTYELRSAYTSRAMDARWNRTQQQGPPLTWCFCSRDGRIRTDDLSVPNAARYQAALRPDLGSQC